MIQEAEDLTQVSNLCSDLRRKLPVKTVMMSSFI